MKVLKDLAGAEDLLLDAELPDTVVQSRGGSDYIITKVNAKTIPYTGTFGQSGVVSIKDKLDNIDTSLDLRNLVSRDTIEDLKLETGLVFNTINVLGYYTPGDGGGGTFVSKTAIEIDPNTGSLYEVDGGVIFAKLGGGFWARQINHFIDVKWYGAKEDYNSVTKTGSDSSMAINNCYIQSKKFNKKMIINGDFFCSNPLIFSSRVGSIPVIEANCNIYFNIDSASNYLTIDNISCKAAVYIGDDTTNGIYQININGLFNITNVGIQNIQNSHGCVISNAAYGQYNITGLSGWDVGLYLSGVILGTFDGKMGAYKNNALDIYMQSNKDTGLSVLRFTNNQTLIKNIKLQSTYKIKCDRNENQSFFGSNHVGSNIVFENIDLESNNGMALSYQRSSSTLYMTGGTEVDPMPLMTLYKFKNIWAENFNKAIPFLKTSSNISFENLFVANKTNNHFIEKLSNSKLVFIDTKFYFGDGEPTYLIKEFDATDKLNNLVMRNVYSYGVNDNTRAFNLFSDYSTYLSAYYSIDLDYYEKRIEIALTNAFTGATDSYMTNAVVSIPSLLTKLFGTSVIDGELTVGSGDGSQYGCYRVKISSMRGLSTSYRIETDFSGVTSTMVTLANGILTYPTTLTGRLFGTRFTFKMNISNIGTNGNN